MTRGLELGALCVETAEPVRLLVGRPVTRLSKWRTRRMLAPAGLGNDGPDRRSVVFVTYEVRNVRWTTEISSD